jgi:hypothetical protein
VGLDDGDLADLAPWVRVVPAVFTGWTVVGVVLGSPLVLWALVPLALVGVLAPRHPFDVLYDRGIRPLLDTPRMPPTAAPRRFAYAVAAAWLVGIGAAFRAGASGWGYVLGAGLVVVEALQLTTLFCLPSWCWVNSGRRLRRWRRRAGPHPG